MAGKAAPRDCLRIIEGKLNGAGVSEHVAREAFYFFLPCVLT